MDAPTIKVHELRKEFKLGGENVEALRGVDLVVERGEMVSIVGPSGSGKSTLLGLIGGLDTPTSGTVIIDGQDISRMNERQLTRIRNAKIGFVFQFFNLIPTLTALENVALPVQFAAKRRFNPNVRARELLTRLGMGDRLRHRPAQLSGGQQQRVAIARALANEPAIILADEPTANLDLVTGEEIIGLLWELCRELGVTVVTATHDHKMLDVSDRILWIKDGSIERLERRQDVDIRVGVVR
jgi:putative ABC transport system ATP-binding protein